MLQQMLMEDKADLVREAVIKSLGIIMGYIDDPDKYQQVCFSAETSFTLLSIFKKCTDSDIWLSASEVVYLSSQWKRQLLSVQQLSRNWKWVCMFPTLSLLIHDTLTLKKMGVKTLSQFLEIHICCIFLSFLEIYSFNNLHLPFSLSGLWIVALCPGWSLRKSC